VGGCPTTNRSFAGSPTRDDHRINLQVPSKEREGEDAVEVTNTMGAAEQLRKYLDEADPDLLRSMVDSPLWARG
jgi:hypothetical protein